MRRSLGGTRVAPPQATLNRSPPAQKKKPAARKRDMPLAETDGQGWIKARRGPKPPTTKARKPAVRKPAAKPVARRAPPHPPSSSSESDAPPPRKPAARRRRPPEDFTKDLAGSDGSVSEPEEAPESDGGLDDARGKKKADASTYQFDDDDDDDDDALDPKRPPRRRIATQESDTQDSVLESKQPARRSGSAVACRSDASDDDRPGPESQDSALSTTTKKKPRSASTTGNDAAIARALASPAGATPDSDDDDFLYASSPGPRRPATKPSKRRPRSDTEEEEAAEVLPEKRPRGAPRERTPTQPSPKPRARRSSQDSDGSVSQTAAPRRRPPRKKRRSAAPKATQDIDIDDFVDSHTPRQSQDDPSDGEDGDSAAWRDAPTAVASVRRWRVRSSGLVWAATGDDYYGDGRRGGFHKRPAYALPHREVASLRLPPPLKNHAYVRVFDDAAFPPWDAPRLVPRSSLLGFRGDASAPRWDPPRVKAMKSKLRAAEFRHVFERGAAAALALALAFDEESDSDEGVQEARPPEESQGDAHQDAVREFLYERRPARLPRLEYEALVDLCVDPHMYGARLARDAYEPASSEVRAAVRAAIEGCALDAAVLDRGRRALDAIEDGSILEFIRFQALQKKQKDTSKEKESAADRLEASRRRAAAEVAAGREKLRAQREARERVAAATEQALREERERRAAEEKARGAALEEYASLVRKRDPRAASGWYYVDDAGARQGPFASTKMRAWLVDGHLSHDLRVAPVFEEGGKLPGTDIMQRIDEIFDEPLLTSAFRSVARPRPPPNAEKPKPPKRKRDDAPKPTGDWLKDSLARQKKGIHHLRHDRNQGPAMLFESHEA